MGILWVFVGVLFLGCGHSEMGVHRSPQGGAGKIRDFFESSFNERVERYPTFQTYLGLKSDYGQLDRASEDYQLEDQMIFKRQLGELEDFDSRGLNEQDRLSRRLLADDLRQKMASYKWRFHSYSVNQMFGFHSGAVSLMINMHSIDSVAEAEAYISRLNDWNRYFDEELAVMRRAEALGIIPPKLVFAKVIQDSQNVITGDPFDKLNKSKVMSPLLKDFNRKITALKSIGGEMREELLGKARVALTTSVAPAFKKLIAYLGQLQLKDNHGAWALPEGKAYYEFLLKKITTTNLSADEIHLTGLREVDRIHGEMKEVMRRVGFKGKELSQFFIYMKRNRKFYFKSNESGRKEYLNLAHGLVKKMRQRLPEWFNQMPKAKLEVKPVEAYREKSAGLAFYSGPALNGSRPGIFYLNLYNMEQLPKYNMEALIYHEALPGHHMQIALSQGMDHLPKFRRIGGYTVYSEGWGLYSERLPKEFGFYKDPYSDFGRLAMELWRACRLVVDTGLHAKRWSREKAINYLKQNTSASAREISKSIDRYLVIPGQATSYMIGMLKIWELKKKAEAVQGKAFNIREFHDQILRNGPLPLSILEEQVNQWLNKSKSSTLPPSA